MPSSVNRIPARNIKGDFFSAKETKSNKDNKRSEKKFPETMTQQIKQ